MQRGIVDQKVWIAMPMTVVDDSKNGTILYLTPGTLCKFPAGLVARKYSGPTTSPPLSRWEEQASKNWEFCDWLWRQRRFLIFKEPGSYFSVYLLWDEDTQEFVCWYVNFEKPFSRSPIGFDTLDLELDLIVYPDRTWFWKDDIEYKEGIRCGQIDVDTARRIDLAKEEMLQRVARQESPFDDQWLDWQPDNDWTIPMLPSNWQQVT